MNMHLTVTQDCSHEFQQERSRPMWLWLFHQLYLGPFLLNSCSMWLMLCNCLSRPKEERLFMIYDWDPFFSDLFLHVVSLTDYWRGWEPDGTWWVYHAGEANWHVVETPSRRWRSWSCFQDLHSPAGQAQSHDAGENSFLCPTAYFNWALFKLWIGKWFKHPCVT